MPTVIDSLIKSTETQENFRRQFEPLSMAITAIENSRIAQTLKQFQQLARAASGHVDEIQRAFQTQFGTELRQIQNLVMETEKRFCLPKIDEATKLLCEFNNSGLANAIRRNKAQATEIQQAMEAMRVPWLNMEDKLRSIDGFVKLQDIGHALRTMPTFDPRLTSALRTDLGDWREEISWPSEIFTNPVARSSFYAKRGLDPTLTAFPANAFEQVIDIADLKVAPATVGHLYHFKPETEEGEEEIALTRTNKAHDRLQRFETQMRKFIDEQMKAVFGENWIKHHVPDEIRQQWLDKRQKAKDHGERERPLIAYADFADYVKIITRDDNWQKVFKLAFNRKTSVQESFQRLYPIRICTMHARPITQDDDLYLYAETKRILMAIDRGRI